MNNRRLPPLEKEKKIYGSGGIVEKRIKPRDGDKIELREGHTLITKCSWKF